MKYREMQKSTPKCPFFEERSFRYCKAMAKKVMIPSRTEKEERCMCDKYKECPLYQEHTEDKNKLED